MRLKIVIVFNALNVILFHGQIVILKYDYIQKEKDEIIRPGDLISKIKKTFREKE